MEWKNRVEDVMVPCKKCGSKVPASSLKLDLDEKKMICPDCVKNKSIHKEIEEEAYHKKENEASQKEEKPTKVGHKCHSCGYKFMVNIETKIPKNCPYCNERVTSY